MDQDLREAVLERDGHQCQLSRLFGITELSGKPCSERLEVHHITYARAGHELMEDLITLCSRCHDYITDAVRQERFQRRILDGEIVPEDCQMVTPGQSMKKGKDHDRQAKVQDCGNSPAYYAQRSTCRPGE